MRYTADLPGRYARTARQIAFTALFLDVLAIAAFFLTKFFGFVMWTFSLGAALLAAIVSVVGIFVSLRCLHPRPTGAYFTLLLSLAILGGYAYVISELADLGTMH